MRLQLVIIYLNSFLKKLDIHHKERSDDIIHESLDSKIMRKYHADTVIKTISLKKKLSLRGEYDINDRRKFLI